MGVTREWLVAYLTAESDLKPGELADDTPLFSSGRLDSFSMVSLVEMIEQEAGIKVRPIDFSLPNLDTIGRILRFVERSAAGRG